MVTNVHSNQRRMCVIKEKGRRDEEKVKEEKRRRKGTRVTGIGTTNTEAQLACTCKRTLGRTMSPQSKFLKKECSLSVLP